VSAGVERVQAWRWDGQALWLLDQRQLPARECWQRCETPEAVGEAIRDMVVRGAPLIGLAAAWGVALAVRAWPGQPERVREAAERLVQARPTAVNLRWAVQRVLARLEREGFDFARAEQEAQAIAREDEAACWRIGQAGLAVVPDGARVLTHCNTGALATAGIGTALGVLRAARQAGRRVTVYCTETRPYLQGARLTAWELAREGFDPILITDGMAGALMAQGKVDLVVVGADRIARNGDVANKVGTYTLAVLARAHGIPFYVAAPFSSVDLTTPDGRAIPIEQRSAAEVVQVAGVPIAPDGVRAWHPAFDVTPAELVDALITDRGLLRPPLAEALAQAARFELCDGVAAAASPEQRRSPTP